MADTSDVSQIMKQVLLKGDMASLTPQERTEYYLRVCESLGLNPLTRPIDYLMLGGKVTLYAKRDATDQLRKLHGVSIVSLARDVVDGVCIVTASARDNTGRTDTSIGAVNVKGLVGDAYANAVMKAETKAKRRVTLSLCGLGWLDETEIETVPGAQPVSFAPPVTDDAASEPVQRATAPPTASRGGEDDYAERVIARVKARSSEFVGAGQAAVGELEGAVEQALHDAQLAPDPKDWPVAERGRATAIIADIVNEFAARPHDHAASDFFGDEAAHAMG